MPTRSEDTKTRGLLDKIHLGVTIVVLGLGGFISWKQLGIETKQKELSSQLQEREQQLDERQTITQQSGKLLENTRIYLDALKLDETKRKRILLSLLKIEKEIRVSQTGELADEHVRATVDALPYHLALLVGDSETLAHIGGQPSDLQLWLPIAKTSGDLDVRRAAIDALTDVAVLTEDPETVKVCLESIVELTRRWNVPELAEQARGAVTAIAESYRRIGAEQGDVHVLIGSTLRELEGSLPETAATQNALTDARTATNEGQATPGADEPTSGIAPGGLGVETPAVATGATTAESLGTGDHAAASNLTALRELRESYESASPAKHSTNFPLELIDQLRSDDVKERRVARSKIADYGDQAVPALVSALKNNSDDYRIAIGVVTALSLMEPGMPIGPDGAESLVALLGHPDPTLRKNTAVYLGRLGDRASVETVRQALEDLSADRTALDNPDLIYNSAIVLGDWLAYNQALPDDLRSSIRQALRTIDERLAADQEHTWRNTRAKIAQYLDPPA